jgi:acetyl-CoA synthetase
VPAEAVWQPTDDFLRNSNIAGFMERHGLASYEELLQAWTADPEWFWSAASEDLGVVWYERPHAVLDRSGGNEWPRWFPGGVTNLVASCVDRHNPDRLAIVWEGEESTVRTLSFGELSALVARIAGGLRAAGISSGDCVGLYLPLAPESVACLYACAKIGAIAIPMFSGFGAEPVTSRLNDAWAKVLITADGFYRRGNVVPMQAIAEKAVRGAPAVERLVVWPRLAGDSPDWSAFLKAEPITEPEPLRADHPFMVAYTSGTTGRAKGAVHTHGGFPLKSATETNYHADHRDGELLFWITDLGWIVAPIVVLGAGLAGRTIFLYDGAADHPTSARMAEMIDKHSISLFGASPTFVRALMRRTDHGFESSPPSLRVLCSTGEPWNELPWLWFFERVGGGRCPIVNLAGGTEAGSLVGVLPIRPLKPTCFTGPAVGVDVDVFGRGGHPTVPGELGELVVKQPWPGQTQGFWDDDERYLATYWHRWPGVWVHGDWASRDEEGYVFLHGRSDDTINVAGKRLGPAEVESVLTDHPAVIECAAVGIPHEVKGETIWCFAVVREPAAELEEELRTLVGERLGRVFAPDRVLCVSALPRTRNAKIVRRAIRDAVTGAEPGDLSSLENPEVLEEIGERARESAVSSSRP